MTFGEYITACAVLLARAHSQSAEWCHTYADKSLDDVHQLRAAAARDIEVADDPAR